MNNSAWIDPRISQLTVANVRDYLLRKNWRVQPYPRPELLVFEGPLADDGEPFVLVLPSSERASDYRMRCEDLVGALGIIENRWAVDILHEMLGAPQVNGPVLQKRGEAAD